MENQNIEQEVMLTKEDFASDQVVKWCPGCGDHAILKAVQDIFPKLGKKKEDIVVVSGIGCSLVSIASTVVLPLPPLA